MCPSPHYANAQGTILNYTHRELIESKQTLQLHKLTVKITRFFDSKKESPRASSVFPLFSWFSFS